MLSPETLFRDGFKTVLKEMGRTGVRFHAFRRFRESVLLASDARQILIDYWMGHENPDMSTRYGKQLVGGVKYRKLWAARGWETKWSGRMDLNHRPPGPEPTEPRKTSTAVSTLLLKSKALARQLGCVCLWRDVSVCS
jgi:hypothetical protein